MVPFSILRTSLEGLRVIGVTDEFEGAGRSGGEFGRRGGRVGVRMRPENVLMYVDDINRQRSNVVPPCTLLTSV